MTTPEAEWTVYFKPGERCPSLERRPSLKRSNSSRTPPRKDSFECVGKDVVRCISAMVLSYISESNRVGHVPCSEYKIFNKGGCDIESAIVQSYPEDITLDAVYQFFSVIHAEAQLEYECMIISLIYLERMIEYTNSRFMVCHHNWKGALLTCLMVSSKIYDDFSMLNAGFAAIFNSLSLTRLNEMELMFVSMINYATFVSGDEYCRRHRTVQESRPTTPIMNPLVHAASMSSLITSPSAELSEQTIREADEEDEDEDEEQELELRGHRRTIHTSPAVARTPPSSQPGVIQSGYTPPVRGSDTPVSQNMPRACSRDQWITCTGSSSSSCKSSCKASSQGTPPLHPGTGVGSAPGPGIAKEIDTRNDSEGQGQYSNTSTISIPSTASLSNWRFVRVLNRVISSFSLTPSHAKVHPTENTRISLTVFSNIEDEDPAVEEIY
mmetsp:Transcript_1808/g.2849  ORF Transcript_1808/g.2849 Transcript_1808/m.2849 type:complete len:439 (-) Transcript_1808:370-1686(-)|eukprot:CAMPEP_0185035398 /NCGR_PEP_ID=MMETSP1103-20130426/26661_1 /TAXON_ID=36769 /ORGANISM="Paraphysomonas bandaiensis, Strain Caron Lab Isolate" /LENGTH=438 /DNA_ID=CAMNT_0027572445 /DNA_START=78 /DNA_END=1394 /DNA_ORIENTATION=-